MPSGTDAALASVPSSVPRRRERWTVAAAAAILFALLYGLAIRRADALDGSYDLGYFLQASWLIAHGKPAFVTVRGLSLLGDHASFVFWPIAWLTAALPRLPTLLAVQSLGLALGVVPLYAVCRSLARLPVVPSLAVLVAYGLYPALNNVNLADFHPEAIAVSALLGAAYFGLSQRWVPYAACVSIAMLSREDLCITVAFLGALLALEGHRRAGLVTAVAAAGWFAVDVGLVMPHFAGGFVQSAVFERYGSGAADVARFLLTHPWQVVVDLGTAVNAQFVWLVLAPVLFLPLVAPRYLMPALPLQLLYLLSDRPAAHTVEGQYTVGLIAFVFLATAMALGQLAQRGGERALLVPLVAAAFFFNTSWSAGGLQAHPWDWNRSRSDRALVAASKRIPDDAAVAGSVRVWQRTAERPELYEFPGPWEGYASRARNDPMPLAERQARTRWILVDTRDPVHWTPTLQRQLARLTSELGFRRVFARDGVELYRR